MDIKDKLMVKKLILKRDYREITELFHNDAEYYMPLLSHNDRKYIAHNACLCGNYWIIHDLLNYALEKEKVNIIKMFYRNKRYISYNVSFEKHFNEYLEAAIEMEHDTLLYHLAVISNRHPERYSKEIKTIKGYFLDHMDADNFSLVASLSNYTNPLMLKEVIKNLDYEALVNIARNVNENSEKYNKEKDILTNLISNMAINYTFLDIVLLPIFKTRELEERILDSNIEFISYYYSKLNIEEKVEFFSKYLLKTPNIEEFKVIADLSKDNDVLYSKLIFVIKNEIKDNELASNYLYVLYQVNPKCELSDLLVTSILELNKLDVIYSLMSEIPTIKQTELADAYLISGNINVIFALACTTDTTKTYNLIDYILNTNDFNLIVGLISELKGRFLSYILDKVIKRYGALTYLKVIDQLYLLGLPNFLATVDFIFKYKLDKLFEREILDRIKLFYTKENKKCQSLARTKK